MSWQLPSGGGVFVATLLGGVLLIGELLTGGAASGWGRRAQDPDLLLG